MIKEALEHIESGEGNCATASYRALLPPGVEPSKLHDHILVSELTQIEHIAACAALAIFRQQRMLCSYVEMPETETPSGYFKAIFANGSEDPAADANDRLLFYGGLIRRLFLIDGGRKAGHVIAVTSVDPANDKVQIIDRGPVEYNSYHYHVPIDELDSLATKQWAGQLARVLLLIGLGADNPRYHYPQYQESMQRAMATWTAWEQSYLPSLENKPALLT
jgi:hypothetical protein